MYKLCRACCRGTLRRNALHQSRGGECADETQKHGAELVNFVISFVNDDISCRDFDLDYSYYVKICKKDFPAFRREHCRLSRSFADTIDQTALIWQMRTFRMQSRMPWTNSLAAHRKPTYSDLWGCCKIRFCSSPFFAVWEI